MALIVKSEVLRFTYNFSTGNERLDDKIVEYLRWTSAEYLRETNNLSARDDLVKLFKKEHITKLKAIMMSRLSFGTAGLRGKMGPGYTCMNDLVIVQTSQGVAEYFSRDPSEKYRSVVIGFDNRYNSERFAYLTAKAFLHKNYKVYLFSAMTPTPYVPFTVKKLKCVAGIMITASHNPKDDNGYKVYGSNGAQILPPHDKNIQDSIYDNLEPWENAFDISEVDASYRVLDPLSYIDQAYFAEMKSLCSAGSYKLDYGITYTAMHGTSHFYMKKVFHLLELPLCYPVKEQMHPNPDFPTVPFPNPEEKNSLDLAFATAKHTSSSIILANDPDADRLAVAEKVSDEEWHVYSGNEIGALLGSWLWESLDPEFKKNPDKCCMVSSTVSSKILRSIAAVEGFKFYETLTGFKWMANKAFAAMQGGENFVFAFEEAIGYMCGSMVLDKDGIHAAMEVIKMLTHEHKQKRNLYDRLKDTYLKYGYHVSCNSYYICHNRDAITKMFSRLRSLDGDHTDMYPQSLNGKFPVSGVRDLTTGYDSTRSCKVSILPHDEETQMITFYFENGCEATFRTSGTEPKVKYYTEMIAKVPESEWPSKEALLHEMVDLMIKHWIQPERNGFQPRPT